MRLQTILLTLFTLLVGPLSAIIASPPDSLEAEANRSASKIKEVVTERHGLHVVDFVDNTRSGGAAVPFVQDVWLRALRGVNVRLTEPNVAFFKLQSEVFVTGLREGSGSDFEVFVQQTLVDKDSGNSAEIAGRKVRAKFEAHIRNTDDIAIAAGATGRILSDADKARRDGTQTTRAERQDDLKDIIRKPTGRVVGNAMSSSPDSPYAVEVWSRAVRSAGDFKPLKPRLESGQPFVDIPRSHVYELRIANHDDTVDHNGKPIGEVAAEVRVDGLSVFHFAEPKFRLPPTAAGKPRFTHYIIAPKKNGKPGGGVIPGWFQRVAGEDNYLSFLIARLGHGAASMEGLGASGNVGAIHIQFSHCMNSDSARARSGSETALGPPRTVQVKAVSRRIDPPHDFLTIRYSR
ncbi:MAG: hypothetical protein AAGI53_17195 [Planctomycetota bacterium]